MESHLMLLICRDFQFLVEKFRGEVSAIRPNYRMKVLVNSEILKIGNVLVIAVRLIARLASGLIQAQFWPWIQ